MDKRCNRYDRRWLDQRDEFGEMAILNLYSKESCRMNPVLLYRYTAVQVLQYYSIYVYAYICLNI